MADFNITHMPCTVEISRTREHREFNWKIQIEKNEAKTKYMHVESAAGI